MARPRTRPIDTPETTTQKWLRRYRRSHRADERLHHLCTQAVMQIGNMRRFVALGDLVRAGVVRRGLRLTMDALARG